METQHLNRALKTVKVCLAPHTLWKYEAKDPPFFKKMLDPSTMLGSKRLMNYAKRQDLPTTYELTAKELIAGKVPTNAYRLVPCKNAGKALPDDEAKENIVKVGNRLFKKVDAGHEFEEFGVKIEEILKPAVYEDRAAYRRFRDLYKKLKEADFPHFYALVQHICTMKRYRKISYDDFLEDMKKENERVFEMASILKDILLEKSVAGFLRNVPFGYLGAPFILELINRRQTLKGSRFHHLNNRTLSLRAPQAVCKRIEIAADRLEKLDKRLAKMKKPKGRVLVVASGPACEVELFLSRNPDTKMRFDFVDSDPSALGYLKAKLAAMGHLEYKDGKFADSEQFRFFNCHGCDHSPPDGTRYAGGFTQGVSDYRKRYYIIEAVKRLEEYFLPNSIFVIGNFTDKDDWKQMMFVCGWTLKRRTKEQLEKILTKALKGTHFSHFFGSVLNGTDLFLHLKKDNPKND
jgi:hypothetical protein